MSKANRIKWREVRHRLCERQGWRCHYCKGPISAENTTVDHLKARSLGGNNNRRNLVMACKKCNSCKGQMSESAFLAATSQERRK